MGRSPTRDNGATPADATVSRAVALTSAPGRCRSAVRRPMELGRRAAVAGATAAADRTISRLPASATAAVALLLLPLCCATAAAPRACKVDATCEPLANASCLGAALPFASTSLAFASGCRTQADAQATLAAWSGLRAAPKCWDVVQPLLCATLVPKCNGSLVDRPTRELCLKTHDPCDFVRVANGGAWPELLDCDRSYFTSDPECKSDTYTRLKFPYNGSCELPLVSVGETKESSYQGISGCGLQCHNALYTDQEHDDLHAFVAVMAVCCFACTLTASLTFVVDWKNASRYPGLMLLYIDVCFTVGCLAWLAQFFGTSSRRDIVCRHDGTVRIGEPRIGSGESASCVVTFITIYYSAVAAAGWFVALAYGWHVTFHALRIGASQGKLESRMSYVHMAAWCCPLILAIICLATQQVDGDSMAGICFVGYDKPVSRALLLLLPMAIALCAGMGFLLLGLRTLVKIRKDSPPEIYERITAKINGTIVRLGVFAGLMSFLTVAAIACQAYLVGNKTTWDKSVQDYIMCTVRTWYGSTTTDDCSLTSRPHLLSQYVSILCYFGAGILMSSWVWTKASCEIWKRFFRRVFRKPSNKLVKLKRHRTAAQAFQKRGPNRAPKLSLDFQSSHDDPLGMKLELHSIASNDVSSTFMQAVPRILKRQQNGVTQPMLGSIRRYSDSDVQSIQSAIESTSKWTDDDSRTHGTKGGHIAGRSRRRSHRGRTRVINPASFNPADILAMQATLNAQCGSSLSGGETANASRAETYRAETHRRPSDASMSSRVTAQTASVTLDKHLQGDDTETDDYYFDPRGNGMMALEAVVPAAHLHQLALATYALFTASSLLPPGGMPGGAPGSMPFGAPGAMPFGAPGAVPFGAPGSAPFGAPGSVPFGAPGSVPFPVPGGVPFGPPGAAPYGGPREGVLPRHPRAGPRAPSASARSGRMRSSTAACANRGGESDMTDVSSMEC